LRWLDSYKQTANFKTSGGPGLSIRIKCLIFSLVFGCQLSIVVVASDVLLFGTLDLAPLALDQEGNGNRGFITDIHHAISDKSQIAIINEVLPLARLMKHLKKGSIDCAVFIRSAWSEQTFSPIAEVNPNFDSVIITRKDLKITRLADLHGKLLAMPRGSFPQLPVSTDPKIIRYFTNSYAQGTRLLKYGRVDAIAGNALSLIYNLETMQLEPDEIGTILTFDNQPLWLHCRKNQLTDEIVSRLRVATDALRNEGVFQRLLDKYTPANYLVPE
jgi:ABC-type amino acid transport substrate-binding protein